MKIIKKYSIPQENHENHETLRIPCDNQQIHENHNIQYENH